MQNEADTSRALFGGVRKAPRIGPVPVPTGALAADLPPPEHPGEECSAWLFCTGCGQQSPVLTSAIPQIIENPPSDWTGKYISVEGCDLCENGLRDARVAELLRS